MSRRHRWKPSRKLYTDRETREQCRDYPMRATRYRTALVIGLLERGAHERDIAEATGLTYARVHVIKHNLKGARSRD